jgi:hypothetical protein
VFFSFRNASILLMARCAPRFASLAPDFWRLGCLEGVEGLVAEHPVLITSWIGTEAASGGQHRAASPALQRRDLLLSSIPATLSMP